MIYILWGGLAVTNINLTCIELVLGKGYDNLAGMHGIPFYEVWWHSLGSR